MEYAEFAVRLGPRQGEGFAVSVERSPAGEGSGLLRLPWEAAAVADLLDRLDAGRRSRSDRDLVLSAGAAALEPDLAPETVGRLLFEALFSGDVLAALDYSLGTISGKAERGLSIQLRFAGSDPDVALLAGLPWELLYDHRHGEFFCFSRRMPLVRYLELPRPGASLPLEPPLRLVLAASQPRGLPWLDLETECRRLQAALQSLPEIEVTRLPRATPEALREALLDQSVQALHFMGHGEIDRQSGEGCLILEDASGMPLPLGARIVARLLGDGGFRLVFLNACDTARLGAAAQRAPFAAVAASLARVGVPAVVAMQLPISDRAAIAFSQAFYRRLALGDSIAAATVEGRQAILWDAAQRQDRDAWEWGTPALFQRAAGELVLVKHTDRAAQSSTPHPPQRDLRPAAWTSRPAAWARRRPGQAAAVVAGAAGASLAALGALGFAALAARERLIGIPPQAYPVSQLLAAGASALGTLPWRGLSALVAPHPMLRGSAWALLALAAPCLLTARFARGRRAAAAAARGALAAVGGVLIGGAWLYTAAVGSGPELPVYGHGLACASQFSQRFDERIAFETCSWLSNDRTVSDQRRRGLAGLLGWLLVA